MEITTINPATGDTLTKYTTQNETQALEIARKTYEQGSSWKETNFVERKKLFKNLAAVLRENKQEYAEMMTNEMGKVIKESVAEVEKCAWLAEVLAEKGEEWLKEEQVNAGGKKHIITFEPLGTVYIVMPWNYPFWQPMKVGLLPLFAGNTILLKHAKNVSGSAMLIEKAFKKAGFPQDTFRSLIISHEVSDKIIASPYVQAVSFTGSTAAGSHIASIAGKYVKKSVLELGGSDAFIVLADADIKKAAQAAVKGRMSNCGQVCIGAKRMIIHKNVLEDFSNEFKKSVSELRIGDPLDKTTDIGPLVDEKAIKNMQEFLDDARNKDASVILGGKKIMKKGFYFEPTIVVEGKETLKMSSEEAFGPVVPIIVVENDEEAIQKANNSIFGLNASLWTKDLEKAERLSRKIEAGGVFVNHISVSHPLIPLGGIKKSGYGRELSHIGIKEFVNIKPLNIYQ